MPKSAPTPPPAPDPAAVSAAQTGSNVNTAVANSVLGNANTFGPTGSTTFSQIGNTKVGDQQVPQWAKTTTLAPAQQQMLDLQNQTGINLNQTALDQSSRIGDLLGHPVSADGLTPFAGTPQAPSFNGLPNGPQLQVAQLQGQGAAPLPIQGSVPVGQQATSFGGAGPINNSYDTSQAPTSFNQGGQIQTGLGNAGDIQRNLNIPGNVQTGVAQNSFAPGFGQTSGQITNSVGPQDFSADRNAVTQAYLDRMNPQLDRDRASLENQLVNQGFVRGTTAFDTQMDQANRQANDARQQAILAGGQEQSRLAGLQLNQANFANQAQNQDFSQQQNRGLFGLQSGEAQNAANLNAGNFANQAQGQQFNQAAQAGQFGNTAQQQAYNQNLGAGQFANTAQAQQYGENQGQGQFAQQGAAQNNATNAAQAAFGNTAQGQLFGQNQSAGAFGNAAVGANNAANLAGGQFGNSAAGQAFAQQQAQQAFNNAVAQGNAAGANDAANQAYQNAVSQTQYGNTNAQQGFANNTANAQLTNQQRAQQLQERFGLQSFPINQITALMSGGQIQAPQSVQYQGGQIAPTNVSGNVYNSAAIQQQQYQNQLQQQNAATGGLFGLGSAALMGGMNGGTGGSANSLIGQGLSAAMMFSDRRLKRDIIDTGVRLMNGLKLYSYRYLWDAVARVGVMADEVAKINPAAVFKVGGYDAVNYDLAMEVA